MLPIVNNLIHLKGNQNYDTHSYTKIIHNPRRVNELDFLQSLSIYLSTNKTRNKNLEANSPSTAWKNLSEKSFIY